MCSLLLQHGANPSATNVEGKTPLDLATADEVKSLLQGVTPSMLTRNMSSSGIVTAAAASATRKTSTSTSGVRSPTASVQDMANLKGRGSAFGDDENDVGDRLALSGMATASSKGVSDYNAFTPASAEVDIATWLKQQGLEEYSQLMTSEAITVSILAEMEHSELKELGVAVHGHRHKMLKEARNHVSGRTDDKGIGTNRFVGVFNIFSDCILLALSFFF